MKVEISEQIFSFVMSQAPEERKKLRRALRPLQAERGASKHWKGGFPHTIACGFAHTGQGDIVSEGDHFLRAYVPQNVWYAGAPGPGGAL